MNRGIKLVKELEKLPQKYYGISRQKEVNEDTINSEVDSYKAMAADTEREKEAREWCNACFDHAVI